MATHNQKPWWELEGKLPPYDAPVEAERERLRSELARAWRCHAGEVDSRSARTSASPRHTS